MAPHRDVETGPAQDERAPLLGQQRSEQSESASPEEDVSPRPQSEASKRREYGWRGFWIVVAILVIAAFVKGWIEADDVDVSGTAKTGIYLRILTRYRSSILREL